MEGVSRKENTEFSQVQGEIIQVLQDVIRMGASDDSEREIIEDILHRFNTGKITPVQAREEIQNFLSSKQEYR